MSILAWVLLGAIIGYAAAVQRKFSIGAGLAAGALLGPAALLLFFANRKPRQ